MTKKATKTCPYCAEEILETAVKCKHCGEFLENVAPYGAAESEKRGSGGVSPLAVCNLFLSALGAISVFMPWYQPVSVSAAVELGGKSTPFGILFLLSLACLGGLSAVALLRKRMGKGLRLLLFVSALAMVGVLALYNANLGSHKGAVYIDGFYLGATVTGVAFSANLISVMTLDR